MFRTLRFRRVDARPHTVIIFFFVLVAALAAGMPAAAPQTPSQPAAPAAAPQAAKAGAEAEVLGPEKNVAMDTFLQFLNKSPEATLRKHPGLTSEVVASIMANRAAGKSFASIPDFKKMTKISEIDFQYAYKPFYEADLRKTTLAATRKPVQPVTVADPKANPQAPGAAAGAPNSEAGPIGAVRAGFYGQLEGYESWDGVDPAVKKEFFETINRERCTCGCTNETLAWCYVNDKSCPVVRPRVKKVYDDLMKRVAASPPSTESTPNPK